MVGASRSADWALSHGRSSLTVPELADLLGVPPDQVRRRLHAPARRGEWVQPVRGLWVPVSPEFRTWGGPPGIELIDSMMGYLGIGYYVGWLSAAGLHGAGHQAVQVFQVAVGRQVRDRVVGRTRFEFAQRHVSGVPTVGYPTRAGSARVSSVAATMLDLATDVGRSGGLDNTVTVIAELAELDAFDLADLVGLVSRFPVAAGRRVGWVLDRFTETDDLDRLAAVVSSGVSTPSRLDPSGPLSGGVDRDWMVHLNRAVEPDL